MLNDGVCLSINDCLGPSVDFERQTRFEDDARLENVNKAVCVYMNKRQ